MVSFHRTLNLDNGIRIALLLVNESQTLPGNFFSRAAV